MSKFKITKDTQGSNVIPIPAPVELEKPTPLFKKGYEFPVAKLVNVVFDPAKETTRDEITTTQPVLIFLFIDEKKRRFTDVNFPIDDADEKFQMKVDAFNQAVKHIWDETIGADKFPEDAIQGDTFAELFESIANAFNAQVVTRKEGEVEKQIKLYSIPSLYLKLVYYKDRLQRPMYPNFVQKAKIGENAIACELMVSSKDNIKPQAKASKPAAVPGGGFGHDASFGSFGDFSDLPDPSN